MDARDWERLKELYEQARALPASERDVFVERACAEDPSLRTEIEELLGAGEQAESFFERLARAVPPIPEEPPPRPPRTDAEPGAEAPDPLLGQTIRQYRIESKLGSGGMGVVYRAHDTTLDRPVALKFLPTHMGVDETAAERFLVEARAAAALDHPNVCAVHEIGETETGRRFLAMACYEGETLRQKLERGPLPVDEAADYARQIAAALAAAHARGIVHRDIKPGNVLVAPEGTVKVLDFGLAKLADVSLTGTGATLGTVAYMAPEQIRGDAVDARTDLWALGVVWYEMLTGRRPFPSEAAASVVHRIQHEEPPPLADWRADVSADTAALIGRLLAKHPDERPVGAHQVLAEGDAVQQETRSRSSARDLLRAIHRRSLWQVLLVYVGGSWAVLAVVDTLAGALGSPDWASRLALFLLIVGLPIVLATAFVQEGVGTSAETALPERETSTGGARTADHSPPPGTGHGRVGHRLFTWRNAILGGVAAAALLSIVTAGYVAIRTLATGGAIANVGLATAGVLAAVTIALGATAIVIGSSSGRAAEPRSIAVLPFDNLGGEAQDAYFSAGITNEIITRLSRIRALTVVSRTSTLVYAGARPRLQEIAAELGVARIVEGTVQREGDRVRITAQLIDTASDRQLWAESYDRDLRDIFAIQTDVARRVADSLEARLTPVEASRLAREPTGDMEAYSLYLRGRFVAERRSPEALRQAIALYRRATERDSSFAAAWAGMADAYVLLFMRGPLSRAAALEGAAAPAARALALDEELPEAHVAMAMVRSLERDWAGQGRSLRRATRLDPSHAFVHHALGHRASLVEGRLDDAIRHTSKAIRLDPLSPVYTHHLGWLLYLNRDYEEALRQYRATAELNPRFARVRVQARIVILLGLTGRFREARRVADAALEREPEDPDLLVALGVLHALSAEAVEAKAVLERAKAAGADSIALGVAYVSVGESERERALGLLSARFEDFRVIKDLAWDPLLDPVRPDPRFRKLLERVAAEWKLPHLPATGARGGGRRRGQEPSESRSA